MAQNPAEIKEKIISTIKARGPSLPVHISSELKIEMLFAGAFLSELVSDQAVKLSDMRVGGSHLYYIPGQEEQLQKFYNHLPGKEKEAFNLLKEKKVLEDRKLEPAIRVALRSIKDFAIPLALNSEQGKILFWYFHSLKQDEAKLTIESLITGKKMEILTKERELGASILEDVKKENIEISSPEKRFEQLHPELSDKPKIEEKIIEKEEILKKPKSAKDSFSIEVQSALTSRGIAVVRVEYFDKKEVILRAVDKQEILVFAFNKKKISDKELVKCYKKALSYKLPYMIIIKDELSKKMNETINASRSLLKVEKL